MQILVLCGDNRSGFNQGGLKEEVVQDLASWDLLCWVSVNTEIKLE